MIELATARAQSEGQGGAGREGAIRERRAGSCLERTQGN